MRSRHVQIIVSVLITLALQTIGAQAAAPAPLRLQIPYEAAWRGMRDTLVSEKWAISSEDQGRGIMVTNFREYSSGTLTKSHIAKIGTPIKLADAYWEKVEFQYEIVVELVEARETLLTAACNIRALKRDFFGNETWVEIVSNGEKERELLTNFGKILFGQKFELEKTGGGFWEPSPSSVPDMLKETPSTLPGPERP